MQFKTTMINMLKAQMKKADNMYQQMRNISRELETIRNNQVEMLAMRSIVPERKNTFNGSPVSRLNTVEERTSECEGKSLRNYPN